MSVRLGEQTGLTQPLIQSLSSHSLLTEIDQLILGFQNNSLSTLEAITLSYNLIEKLNNLREIDLPLTREGLCYFLRLNIEEIQRKAIAYLKPLFHASYLSYDVTHQQSRQFIELEGQISAVISSNCRSFSSSLLFSLIDLYKDILERLWLLPRLIESRDSYDLIIKENGQLIISRARDWISALLKEDLKDRSTILLLNSLNRMLTRIVSCSPDVDKEIAQLGSDLALQSSSSLTTILLELGEIYEKVGDSQKVITYFQEVLDFIDGHKNETLNIEKPLEDLFNLTVLNVSFMKLTFETELLNRIGIAYHRLGDYYKSLKYFNQFLKVAQSPEEELRAYLNLGHVYHSLGNYTDAIKSYKEGLGVAQGLRNSTAIKKTYISLGNACCSLGKYELAINCIQESLKVTDTSDDREKLEAHAYESLGNIYLAQGKYQEATQVYGATIQLYDKGKIVSQSDQTIPYDQSRALGKNLGIAYGYMGEYRKAIEHFNKHLQIAQENGDLHAEGMIYGNLGSIYVALGEPLRAIEYYKKDLQIAKDIGDHAGEGEAYAELGFAYQSLSNYDEATSYYQKALQIAQETGSLSAKVRAYGNLGIIYHLQRDLKNALEHLEESLSLAMKIGSLVGAQKAYGNIGNVYYSLKQWDQALVNYKTCLQRAEDLRDPLEQAVTYRNLGCTYKKINNFKEAETCFLKSVSLYSNLQNQLGDKHQWKITIFENQVGSYLELERILLEEGRKEEALQVADSRRSRVLVSSLSKKIASSEDQPLPAVLMMTKEMQSLAQKLDTTFVIYSFSPLDKDDRNIGVWIVRPYAKTIWQSLPFHNLPGEMKDPSKIFQAFPYVEVRPQRGQSLDEAFNKKLSQWYETLIVPIEEHLPQGPQQTLTIIPDGFLSHLPFAAFQDQKGKYLIEKHPILIAPSIATLQLLSQFPRPLSETSLVVGNPITPDPKANDLQCTEREVMKVVVPLLKTPSEQVLIQQAPAVNCILEKAQGARFIHLTCHGLPEKKLDPHSVFEGIFKLVKDDKHPDGYLHAQEIVSLSLQAELVFMSACHSGRGKLQREGSIGPIWSFIAAGALSTVATYWPLPNGDLTMQMVETFYRHMLGIGVEKLNKAQALQKAMLMAMKKAPDKPRQWAAFFLSGLIE